MNGGAESRTSLRFVCGATSAASRRPEIYQPIPFTDFGGGLNLRDGPDVIQEREAVDLLNVEFTERGALRQRSGYAKFTAEAAPASYDSITPFYTSGGTKQLVANRGAVVEAIDASGGSVATTGTTSGPHHFTRFGQPTAETLYIANGIDQVKKWDGTAFSSPASLSSRTEALIGQWPTSNRLVLARSFTYPSRVWFSDAGDPETFDPDNFVDLTPGDGEEIMAIETWRELLFVFKRSRFFVFYGESQDSSGDEVFDSRPVDARYGCASSRAVATAPEGVYFLDRSGIYRTTGEQPERVSDIVQPIFLGGGSAYYRGGVLTHAAIEDAAMVWFRDRIYLAFATGATNDRMLVFDPRYEWWSLFDIPANGMCVFRAGDVEELLFAYASGSNHIGRYDGSGHSSDDMTAAGTGGDAIGARWRSGWFDYDDPSVKTIRESKLWGSGSFEVGISRDWQLQTPFSAVRLSGSAALWGGFDWDDGTLWGPAEAVISVLVRSAQRGTLFSTHFRNVVKDASFSIHRLEHHIREARIPSVHRA